MTELLDLCMRADLETSAFVLNDQLGRGRSSTTAVIMLLIQRWLRAGHQPREPSSRNRSLSRPRDGQRPAGTPKTSWQIINSCLRVIRNGLEVKGVGQIAPLDEISAEMLFRWSTRRSMLPPRTSTSEMRSKTSGARQKKQKIPPRNMI